MIENWCKSEAVAGNAWHSCGSQKLCLALSLLKSPSGSASRRFAVFDQPVDEERVLQVNDRENVFETVAQVECDATRSSIDNGARDKGRVAVVGLVGYVPQAARRSYR